MKIKVLKTSDAIFFLQKAGGSYAQIYFEWGLIESKHHQFLQMNPNIINSYKWATVMMLH